MISNPFLLQMVSRILPQVVNKHKNHQKEQLEQIQLMKTSIYDKFTDLWFARNNGRLITRNIAKIDLEVYKQFSTELANRMLSKGLMVVKYERAKKKNRFSKIKKEKESINEWDIFFDPEDIELCHIREGIPIRRLGENTWTFIHKSLLEYFGSKYFQDQAVNHKIIKDQKNKPKIKKESGYSDITTVILNDQPSIVKFLAEMVDQNPKFEEKLWEYIESCKINPNLSIAAANAMTILNVAHRSFREKDLSGINVSTFIDGKWQGPNISGGMFGGTNFSNADLRGSIMFGSWYQKANFTKAKLYYTDLGIAKKTFKGHANYVNSVSFSRDGKYIASGSNDNTVKLWSVSTGNLIKEFKGHANSVRSVSFSRDGKYIASGSDDKTVKLWSISTGNLIKEFNIITLSHCHIVTLSHCHIVTYSHVTCHMSLVTCHLSLVTCHLSFITCHCSSELSSKYNIKGVLCCCSFLY